MASGRDVTSGSGNDKDDRHRRYPIGVFNQIGLGIRRITVFLMAVVPLVLARVSLVLVAAARAADASGVLVLIGAWCRRCVGSSFKQAAQPLVQAPTRSTPPMYGSSTSGTRMLPSDC